MDVHFHLPLEDMLKRSLAAMKTWLKRVEGSRKRQSLLQAAKTKIAQIHNARQYVDDNAILRLSNRELDRWLHKESQQTGETQTPLDQFFRQ